MYMNYDLWTSFRVQRVIIRMHWEKYVHKKGKYFEEKEKKKKEYF